MTNVRFTLDMRRFALACLLALAVAALNGCGAGRSVNPAELVAPYDAPRDVIWAVAPFRNESGVSSVDVLALSDALANEAQQIRGVTVLPVNRTLRAMEAMQLPIVDTPSEALALARALNADALLVGSITAWDPYEPLELGLSVGLFARSETMRTPAMTAIDPLALQSASTDQNIETRWPTTQPVSAVARYFNGGNGDTINNARDYASGRSDASPAMGWRVFLKSMDAYARFACHETLRELIAQESRRLSGLEQEETPQAP